MLELSQDIKIHKKCSGEKCGKIVAKIRNFVFTTKFIIKGCRHNFCYAAPYIYGDLFWETFFLIWQVCGTSYILALPCCILSHILWYNIYIKNDNKVVYLNFFQAKNINVITQLFYSDGSFKNWKILNT